MRPPAKAAFPQPEISAFHKLKRNSDARFNMLISKAFGRDCLKRVGELYGLRPQIEQGEIYKPGRFPKDLSAESALWA
jgi:hypothetical protein